MRPVQPLLRLTVLLVAAAQGRARVPEVPDDEGDAPSPRLAPRYDFSRYFGGGGGADPGGGLGAGLGAKAAASSPQEDDSGAGFVDAVDFKSFFGGSGLSGQQKNQPFYGASAQSGSRLPFGSFGAVAAASSDEQDDFADFKSKRGAGAVGASSASRARGAPAGADDDFFHFDFPEGGGDKAADLHDEDADDKDEADEDDRPTGLHRERAQPLKQAGNARYPSYSSYYHTQPEQLRAAAGAGAAGEDQDDDYGFDEDEPAAGLAAEDERGGGARGSGAAATSAEAYDSRPFQDGRGGGGGGLTGSSYSSPSGPARFNLQGGFVPSPVDPLRTQATAAQAAHTSSAASHAAVHAAVKAAHRAASKHGKPGAGAGAALALGAVDSPGAGRPFNVRRTREEPDDAFFESFTDDRDSDDYKFSPEHFDEEDDGEGHAQQAAEAEGDDEAGRGGGGGHGQSAAASAGRCKKVVKKGAVCMVCADPKTGGNYEQCQYATEPETQSYSFGRSSSYGNPRPASRRRRRREEDRARQQQEQDSSQQDSSLQDSQEQQDKAGQQEAAGGEPGGIDAFGEALADSHEKDHAQIEKELDSSLEQLQGPKYEDYFSFLFPELSKEKSQEKSKDEKSGASKKKSKSKKKKGKKKKVEAEESEDVSSLLSPLEDDEEDPFAAETTSGSGLADLGKSGAADLWLGPPESVGAPGAGVGVVPKKDLERMLGEFQQKDRSDCTKVEKDKMTCYQCVDKKGMQHEECMFVAASEPKQSHLAYHQSTAFKAPGPPPAAGSGAKSKSAAPATASPAPTSAPAQRPAASNAAPKTAPAPAPASKGAAKSRQQRAAEQAKDDDQEDDDEKDDLQDADDEGDDDPEGPQGLGQAPDDGMFVEETRPVFDRALRMSLPKYMLERSEHERVFDEALAAGV